MSQMAEKPKVLLYIDNSNIFINTQEFSAWKKKFPKGVKDSTCRIDIGKLVKRACDKRVLLHGKLYGSEPPALDTVWKAIREKKIEVYHSERSTWNSREKQTDTNFVAAATEALIVLQKEAGDDRTIILFTGDKDMMPVVYTALRWKWHVEIWAYKSSMSAKFKEEANKSPKVTIVFLDDYFEEMTFAEYIWGGNIPIERSFVLRYGKIIEERDRKRVLREAVKCASNLFKLPFMAKYSEQPLGPTDLILVPCVQEQYKSSSGELHKNYDFNILIWTQIEFLKKLLGVPKIMTYIDYWQEKEGIEFDISTLEVDGPEDDVDLYDAAVAEGEFITLTPKKNFSPRRYSGLCSFNYSCKWGKNCSYSHRDSEKEFFREHPNVNRALYKYKLCQYSDKCKYVQGRKEYLCPFAHSITEARCIRCKHIGIHWTDECDIN